MNNTIELSNYLKYKDYTNAIKILYRMINDDVIGLNKDIMRSLFKAPKKLLLDYFITSNILSNNVDNLKFMDCFLTFYCGEYGNDEDFFDFFDSAHVILNPGLNTIILYYMLQFNKNKNDSYYKHRDTLLNCEHDPNYCFVDRMLPEKCNIVYSICERLDLKIAKHIIDKFISVNPINMTNMIIAYCHKSEIIDYLLMLDIDFCETGKGKSLLKYAQYGNKFEEIINHKNFRFSDDYDAVKCVSDLFNLSNYTSHFKHDIFKYPSKIRCSNDNVLRDFLLYCEKTNMTFDIDDIFKTGNHILIKYVCQTRDLNKDDLFDNIFNKKFDLGFNQIARGHRLKNNCLELQITKIVLLNETFVLKKCHVNRIKFCDNEIYELIKKNGFDMLKNNVIFLMKCAIMYEDFDLMDKIAPHIEKPIVFKTYKLRIPQIVEYLKIRDVEIAR